MPINFHKRLNELEAPANPVFLEKYLELVLDYPKVQGYTEGHHILPRSLFPAFKSDPENLVLLRGRDHLLAHYYLARAFPSSPSMANAYLAMSRRDAIPANKKLSRGHHLGPGDLPVPDDDLLTQYEESRRLWSEHMQARLTVRVQATGEAIQISRDEYDPCIHEPPTVGFASFRKGEGQVLYLPTDHPDVLSGKVQHVNKGQRTVEDLQTGKFVQLSRAEIQASPGRYRALRAGLPSTRPNQGKTAIIDEHGVFAWVPKNHPHLEEHLTSGRWHYPFKGKLTVRDAQGNKLSVDVGDPRLLSGELVPTSKGRATVRDAQGNTFQVDKDDPRIASGELVAQNTGRVRVLDAQGREQRVYPDDPRLRTGEFKLKELKKDHPVTMVRGWDAEGKEHRLRPDDPRLAGLYRSKKDVPGWVDPRKGRSLKKA